MGSRCVYGIACSEWGYVFKHCYDILPFVFSSSIFRLVVNCPFNPFFFFWKNFYNLFYFIFFPNRMVLGHLLALMYRMFISNRTLYKEVYSLTSSGRRRHHLHQGA